MDISLVFIILICIITFIIFIYSLIYIKSININLGMNLEDYVIFVTFLISSTGVSAFSIIGLFILVSLIFK